MVSIIRPDRELIAPLHRETAEVRRAIDAHGLKREFREALLDFGPLDLEDGAFRTRALALGLPGQRSKFGELKSRQVDLKFGDRDLFGSIDFPAR